MGEEKSNRADPLPQELLSAMERGVTVITPNERAARRLRRIYDRHQLAQGIDIWSTAKVMSLNAWLKRCWSDAVTEGRILSPVLISQEHSFALWEQIIRGSATEKEILNVAGAAELAQQAFELMHLYGVAAKEPLPLDSAESRAFHQWSAQYQKKLDQEKWVDGAGLAAAVSQAFTEKTLAPPVELCLYAMDDLRPSESALFSSLRHAGCSITESSVEELHSTTHKLACENVEQEIMLAAQWTRKRLTENPSARIGVVVPQLSGSRQKIERTFLFELQHNSFLKPDAADRPRAFEVSLGVPFSEHPLIATALVLLRLASGKIEFPEICTLLRSAYVGGGMDEPGQRSLLEAALRRYNILDIDTANLIRIASETKNGIAKPFNTPLLCARLSVLAAASRQEKNKLKPSSWSKVFLQLLKDTGWPGDRTLNSSEYQAQQKFKKMLADLAALDAIHAGMNFAEAVQVLQRMAARQIFQLENLDAPVQVLGPLEAAGSCFDHLWVLGLNEDAWPANGAPNPFLPLLLQRKHLMPHSSAAVDLEFTQMLTDRLLTSASEVVVSFARMDADRELRPSPLIEKLAPISEKDLGIGGHDIQAAASPSLSDWSDSPLPHPPQAPDATLPGGTRIFELQSACAFRAFAELRLGATPLDEPALGLDALDRGNLAHKVMYRVWNEIKDSRRLHELAKDPEQFAEWIRSNVQIVLQDESALRGGEWHIRYAQLEHERLSRTVQRMLALDLERPQAFSVEHKEEKEQIELGGLRMSIRKDRVDRLDDGRSVILDYKSGVKTPGAWKTDRPDEPQLPVYAVTSKDPLAAVAFANLKAGKEGYNGIAADDGILPGVKSSERSVLNSKFADQIKEWRTPLEKLASGYISGSALVAPKDRVVTCKHCGLQTLCRVAELDPTDPIANDGGNGGSDEPHD